MRNSPAWRGGCQEPRETVRAGRARDRKSKTTSAIALPGARHCSRRDAAVLPTDVTAQVMFCFVFLFYFFPLCSIMVAAIILRFFFFQIFSFTFYYVFLYRNSLDKDFRNILLKNYIEHCAYKLYDELVRKKSS